MSSIRPLIPLLIAAGVLLAGNGLQGTLIALRGAQEGFSASTIGLMGTTYFAGFLVGCLIIPRLLQAVGHIRTFAALAAIASSASLTLILAIEPVTWMAMRLICGFCFSGLFMTVDSWINSGVSNKDRASVLSIYRIIDIVAVTGSQYLIPVLGPGGFAIFAIMAMMISLSLVPVSIADRSNPQPPESFKLDFRSVWITSPLACLGCLAIGLTNSAFRLVGPIYARDIGLSVADVATFMSAGILGGAILQYPFGYLSDRGDRRYVLLMATTGAVLSGLGITYLAGSSPALNFAGIFLFGAFSLPLYSLAAAHANDHAKKGEFVQVAAGLLFFFSLGATIGPVSAAAFVQFGGPKLLFNYISLIHALLIFATIWRMRARGAVPVEGRRRFSGLLRTSTDFNKLARKPRNAGSGLT